MILTNEKTKYFAKKKSITLQFRNFSFLITLNRHEISLKPYNLGKFNLNFHATFYG